ncbi:class I SAM-dependent methyltransferase [Ruminococcus sp. 5_1_39BFAA]|uniref:class I SAM-dependent methyltransferase n=1 Tax=Ruminococcus sp. 5_1_39BFAA TaxID=457412 RepID=UPI00356790AE
MNKHSEQIKSTEDIIFYAKSNADRSIVRLAEEKLKVNAIQEPFTISPDDFYLLADKDGLSFAENGHVLRGDFTKLLPRLIPNNLNHELLVKASKLKGIPGPLTAVDATAGLGEDAFLLAAAGFQVQLYERNPIIALLLYDALRRGLENPDLATVIGRMELHMEDSIAMLPQLTPPPDIVVLDPMFPSRQKSGLIKKKFQLLHQLEQPCSEEKILLDAAMSCSPRRIVIKRPMKGSYLAGVKPSYTLKGKSIRYDCIVVPQRN